jgi:hypothetical protein
VADLPFPDEATERKQREMCARFAVPFTPPRPDHKVGVNLDRGQDNPIHALRHPPEGSLCGWFVWDGDREIPASDPDFFEALHLAHLPEWCSPLTPYLALPPGWRVLIASGYEDVWFDPTLMRLD